METRSTTTTSVVNDFEASSIDADYISRSVINRGRAESHYDLDISAYLKPLSRKETSRAADTQQDSETFDDIIEFNYGEEEKTQRSLGRAALSPFVGIGKLVGKAEKGAAYVSAWTISKLPRTMSLEERAAYQDELNEKYASKPGDSWIDRTKKFYHRNKLKARDRVVPYAIGALAMSRVMPHALDLGVNLGHGAASKFADFDDWFNKPKPRTVSMGDGEGFDMAANAIEYTPVEHEISDVPLVLAMGGHTQGDAERSGYVASLEAAGVVAPHEDVVPINWSAQMGPLPGDTMPMDVSDQEGAARLLDAVRDAEGRPIKVVSFSQGTQATLRAMNEIAAQNGGRLPDNMEVVLIGTPSGSRGMGNNNIVGAAGPILDAMGFEIDQPIPEGNVTVRTQINDVFGNSAGQSAAFTGLMAVSPGHNVNGGVLLYSYKEGSTTYEVWGPASGMNHPVSELLEANGVPVSPELDNLFNAAVPRTELGQPTRYTDVNETADALGTYVESVTGNTGMASGAINAVMTPQVAKEFQDFADLQKLPDQFAAMAADPSTIPQKAPEAIREVTEAINAGVGYLENPNKLVDMANNAMRGANIPFKLPPIEQMLPPAQHAPAPSPVFTPPAPVVEAAPVFTPPPAFVPPAPVFTPAPAPAPATEYAPVGNIFGPPKGPTQYAPVGNIFGR